MACNLAGGIGPNEFWTGSSSKVNRIYRSTYLQLCNMFKQKLKDISTALNGENKTKISHSFQNT